MGFVWGSGPSASFGASKPQQQPNSGSFTGNQYGNPNMGSYGGGYGGGSNVGGFTNFGSSTPAGYGGHPGFGLPQPSGLAPGDFSWYEQYRSPQELIRNIGEVPGGFGGESFYDPYTGKTSFKSSDIMFGNAPGAGGSGIRTIDPNTGKTYYNIEGMMGQFSGGAGGGGAGYQSYQMTDYQGGQVTPGEGYQGFDYDTIGSGIDPAAVIAAQEYKLQEAMKADMARAGGRAGASGFAMSTPYMGELGEAARKASQDRNALTMQYQYDAAQAQAARDLAQQQQAAQLDYSGWQTGYQGDLQSQMFNEQQAYNQWALENQLGFADTQGLNAYNTQQQAFDQQNQMQQQNFLANLLGGIL